MPLETVPVTPDDALDEALAAYFQAADEGRAFDPQPWLARYPQLAGPLEAALADLKQFERWTDPVRQLCQSAATKPPDTAATLGWTDGPGDAPIAELGDFEQLTPIGEGGMGIVYRAWQRSLKRWVALKMVRTGQLATSDDLRRFRHEAELIGQLDHPHIVPVYAVGEEAGRLFYTMKLIDGGSLAARLKDVGLPPGQELPRAEAERRKQALVRMVVQLARAVHYAHQRGILHRDLKPANVLLMNVARHSVAEGEVGHSAADYIPMITDFGLARRVAGDGPPEESGTIIGTACYMAPEQAAGRVRALTTAADVYGLGAILYELLTGRPPFKCVTIMETLQYVQWSQPGRPRTVQPLVDRDLETVCLKCLEKDPRRRPRSAEALAESLECWLAGKPIPDRPVGTMERIVRWGRRHPFAAAASVAVILLLLLVTGTALAAARARAMRLEEAILRSNVFEADNVASKVLWQLDRLSEPVVQAAADSRLRDILLADKFRPAPLREYVLELQRRLSDPAAGFPSPEGASSFQSFHILDRAGTQVADSNVSDRFAKGPLPIRDYRDYFTGAVRKRKTRGRGAVHISRVYKSEDDGLYKFAIAAAIRGPADDDPVLGVVAATVTTASTLGMLRLDDGRREVVLVGRRDLARPGRTTDLPPDEYLVLLHQAYNRGDEAIRVESVCLAAVHRPKEGDEFRLVVPGDPRGAMDRHYRDPLASRDDAFAGRWLAGFAPVGNTELVVIVQQRFADAIPPDHDIVLGAAALAGGLIALGWFVWYVGRRAGR